MSLTVEVGRAVLTEDRALLRGPAFSDVRRRVRRRRRRHVATAASPLLLGAICLGTRSTAAELHPWAPGYNMIAIPLGAVFMSLSNIDVAIKAQPAASRKTYRPTLRRRHIRIGSSNLTMRSRS